MSKQDDEKRILRKIAGIQDYIAKIKRNIKGKTEYKGVSEQEWKNIINILEEDIAQLKLQ